MQDRLQIKMVKFERGERYPCLIDQEGIPEWYPTLFATTQVRGAGRATNTIVAALSAIRMLVEWAEKRSIDLDSRFARRKFLLNFELDDLKRRAQTSLSSDRKEIFSVMHMGLSPSLESARARLAPPEKAISHNTVYALSACT